MAVQKEADLKSETIEKLAGELCVAARTAPKTRGVDLIEVAVVTGEDIKKLSAKMSDIFKREGRASFGRNAEEMELTSAVVVIGSRKKTSQLKPCSFCGFKDCEENEAKGGTCAFNSIDLGIALGSAISAASDKRVDNRLMWTIGIAALELGMFGSDVKLAIGVPLSATGKNIYFDRK